MIPKKFSSSISPFEAKNTTPVTRVSITNTPLTTKSLGLNQVGYLLTDSSAPDWAAKSNLTKQYEGITNIVGFFASHGTPIGILRQDNFSVRYDGSFFHPDYTTSRDFTFRVIGFGNIRVQIGSTDIFGSAPDTYQALDPRVYNESSSISLSVATRLIVEYYTTKDLDSSGFCLLKWV